MIQRNAFTLSRNRSLLVQFWINSNVKCSFKWFLRLNITCSTHFKITINGFFKHGLYFIDTFTAIHNSAIDEQNFSG